MEPNRPPSLDRQPRYPERIAIDLPRGATAKLRQLAERQGTSVNAIVRAALLPIVEPFMARDLVAFQAMPAGPERDHALDILAIKYGDTLPAWRREAAGDAASDVVSLEPRSREAAPETPAAA